MLYFPYDNLKKSYCLIFCENLSCGGALPHTAYTGWIKPVLAGLTNHNLCDMFYTLTKMFVYKLLLRVSQNSGHYQKNNISGS